MDLKQQKLSKSEWESVEIPVSEDEAAILKLITSGFTDVNIKTNKTNSLIVFLKIEYSEQMEDFLYNRHFSRRISHLFKESRITYVKFSNDNNKYRAKKEDAVIEDREQEQERERERETDKDGNVISLWSYDVYRHGK